MNGDVCYTIQVKLYAPPGQSVGIKEGIAMYLEQFGGVQVLSVEEKAPEQTSFWNKEEPSYGS